MFILKEIRSNKSIFFMLFIGFLLSILSISIAISTNDYYTQQFYAQKSGYFKYAYSILLDDTGNIELADMQTIAEKHFIDSSVITEQLWIKLPKLGPTIVIGLLDYNWTPPLIEGEALSSDEPYSVIIGKKVMHEGDSIQLYSQKYRIAGIAAQDEEYKSDAYNIHLYIPLKYMPDEIARGFKSKPPLEIIVRSDHDPMKEIDGFVSELKALDNNISTEIIDKKSQYVEELNSNERLKEMLSLPYRLFAIALINGISISYLWIYNKRKNLSLRKALGASNLNLFMFIFTQLLLCAAIAVVFAFIAQGVLIALDVDLAYLGVSFAASNVIGGIIASLAVSLVTSLIPFLQTINMQPAKALKEMR